MVLVIGGKVIVFFLSGKQFLYASVIESIGNRI